MVSISHHLFNYFLFMYKSSRIFVERFISVCLRRLGVSSCIADLPIFDGLLKIFKHFER
ncbi:hypothetical protein Hanom_Chr14g01262021 [Helianthus anomalus]